MTSIVDICNLALSRLGDAATVSSIDPPEGSVQAQHCARFYAVAVREALDAFDWNFATKRATLARYANAVVPPGFQFGYALPTDLLHVIRIENVLEGVPYYSSFACDSFDSLGVSPPPIPYDIETMDGSAVLFTTVESVSIQYVGMVNDPNKFSPGFVAALSWLLASHLSGPVVQGAEGRQMMQSCYQAYSSMAMQAASRDARQRAGQRQERTPSWIAVR